MQNLNRLKKIVDMPLSEKLVIINKYIKDNGLNVSEFNVENMGNHRGKEAMVDFAYNKITTPHLISSQ